MKFNVGDVISSNVPLVHAISKKMKNDICDYCLDYNKQLKRCSGCMRMFYCGRECQRADWAKHKYECKLYARHYDELCDHNVSLFLRLLLFLTNQPKKMSQKFSLFYDKNIGRSFQDIKADSEEVLNDGLLSMIFRALCFKFTMLNIPFDKDKFSEMYYKSVFSNFAIYDRDMNVIAAGVYVAESMIGHSCTPNAAIVFNGIIAEIRCIRPTAENEPITICYTGMADSKVDRQKKLKSIYLMDCKCPRCEQDLPAGFDYKQLQRSKALMLTHMQNREWRQAYRVGKEMTDAYALVHENLPHPHLTVHLAQLVAIRMNFIPGPDEEGVALATKAASMVKLTYREDYAMYQTFKRFMS